MSNDALEQRIAALESAVIELRAKLESHLAACPHKRWWNEPRAPMTEEDRKAWEEMEAYGRYYRVTGKDPPSDWKPGDPIPEPEWWGPEPSGEVETN